MKYELDRQSYSAYHHLLTLTFTDLGSSIHFIAGICERERDEDSSCRSIRKQLTDKHIRKKWCKRQLSCDLNRSSKETERKDIRSGCIDHIHFLKKMNHEKLL